MRHRFAARKTNGYDSAFLIEGKRRIIIDVERFWEILREKQVKKEE